MTKGFSSANGTMTSNSSFKSALPPLKEVAGAESASPYGTRSRNRPGQARPNYAEDKDMDFEFQEKKDAVSRKNKSSAVLPSGGSPPALPSSTGASIGGAAESATATSLQQQPHSHQNHQNSSEPSKTSSRKRASPDISKNGSSNGAKDASSSSNAGTPNPNSGSMHPAKKRKTGGNHNSSSNGANGGNVGNAGNNHNSTVATSSNMQSQIAAQYFAANQGVLEKWRRGYNETNILTFEGCGGHPKNEKLMADDGTVLEVNGMYGHST